MSAKWRPQAILSSRDNGYDVQFEEMKGKMYVCRKCSFHFLDDDARMTGPSIAIKHLNFHLNDGHRIDPGALQLLQNKL